MHTPVLLKEAIDSLQVAPGGRYIDATVGHGGHALEIIKRGGQVLSIDWDKESLERLKFKNDKLKKVCGNYADIKAIAIENNFSPCEGIIFDLGISMGQILYSGRGLSFKALDEPIDMRISTDLEMTAQDIINSYSKEALYEIFAKNAQELSARSLADAIVRARRLSFIQTVGQFNEAIVKVTSGREEVLRRIYQSLRMEVNHERENIVSGIKGALSILIGHGRLAIISFNETEDRIVKQTVKALGARFVNKKPTTVKSPYSFERIAKLRIIEKYDN